MNVEEETYKFLGVTEEDVKVKEIGTLFKLTCRLYQSLVNNISEGKINLTNENNEFEAITSGNKEMYFLGAFVKLRQEVDKLMNRRSI